MNWVDAVVAAVMVISVVLGAVRGFVRDVLGIGAWAGAFVVAWWGFPFVEPRFLGWFGDPNVATAAAYGALFLAALILFSIMTGMVGGLVRGSPLSGIDSTLGLAFGVVRGVALLAAAYIGLGLVVEPGRWPAPLQEARSTPWVYEGAVYVANLLPAPWRPVVKPPPAQAVEAAPRAEQLLPPPSPPPLSGPPPGPPPGSPLGPPSGPLGPSPAPEAPVRPLPPLATPHT